ncbi:MAG: DUF2178 domain-containing protein [Bacteroidales bacterium]|nr:DUF2178 domain-containing protein [Bacteroidales bacterium]MBN2756859.1 DUF2178 domain-containing protein [Bacteroidales bacterium]
MRKIFLPIFIITFSLVISGITLFQSKQSIEPSFLEYVFVGILIIFFVLGLYFSLERIQNKKNVFAEEDELFRKISEKASSVSYYFSLLLWVILICVQNNTYLDIKWIFLIGIIGMASMYVFSWLIIKSLGFEE